MTYQDTTPRVGPLLKDVAVTTHVRAKYRPMRGQAYVRLERETSSVLHLLSTKPEEQKSHRGTVLDLGEPARIGEWEGAPECPWDIRIGDTIYFNLFAWLDKMRTLEFHGVKGDVMVVAQGEIIAVEEVVPLNERETWPELPDVSRYVFGMDPALGESEDGE